MTRKALSNTRSIVVLRRSCFPSSLQRVTDVSTYQQLLAPHKKIYKTCPDKMPLSTDWLILNAQSCWLVLKKIKIPRR